MRIRVLADRVQHERQTRSSHRSNVLAVHLPAPHGPAAPGHHVAQPLFSEHGRGLAAMIKDGAQSVAREEDRMREAWWIQRPAGLVGMHEILRGTETVLELVQIITALDKALRHALQLAEPCRGVTAALLLLPVTTRVRPTVTPTALRPTAALRTTVAPPPALCSKPPPCAKGAHPLAFAPSITLCSLARVASTSARIGSRNLATSELTAAYPASNVAGRRVGAQGVCSTDGAEVQQERLTEPFVLPAKRDVVGSERVIAFGGRELSFVRPRVTRPGVGVHVQLVRPETERHIVLTVEQPGDAKLADTGPEARVNAPVRVCSLDPRRGRNEPEIACLPRTQTQILRGKRTTQHFERATPRVLLVCRVTDPHQCLVVPGSRFGD